MIVDVTVSTLVKHNQPLVVCCTLFVTTGMFAYVAELATKSELFMCLLKVVSGTWLCPETKSFLCYLWKHGH